MPTTPMARPATEPGGCADVLIGIAAGIDARRFNPGFPKVFPRFVQHAIWRYCAQSCLDICNGNQIDDRGRCTNMWCQLVQPLRSARFARRAEKRGKERKNRRFEQHLTSTIGCV